jgi:excisionase family DNA binding protein
MDVIGMLRDGTVDVDEVSALTGSSPWQIYSAIRRGELTAVRVGRRLRIPRSVLRAYLEECLTSPIK